MSSISSIKRRRGRPPKDQAGLSETRECILRSGMEILTEKGYLATGIDEVLRQVDVPKGSFYHYFDSKEGFGLALIKSYSNFFMHKLDKHLNDKRLAPIERLNSFLVDATKGMARYNFRRGCLVGNLGQEMSALPESFRNAIRGVFEAFAAICFFIGVATLPFGMVYVLLSLAPIFMTAFGALFLNEKVRWKRWTAVILGFIGIIIVINPKELEFGYFFIFPLLSAILLSFRDMYTKNIKGNFHSLQIAFITCLVVTIFFGVLSIYKFYSFNLEQSIILIISAFFLSFGYIFSVLTIKAALVSVTSTFRYTAILWGILYGYFFFNETPEYNTYLGAVMIVISGLIIIMRQKQLGKIK